jgi:hypothetical protein
LLLRGVDTGVVMVVLALVASSLFGGRRGALSVGFVFFGVW